MYHSKKYLKSNEVNVDKVINTGKLKKKFKPYNQKKGKKMKLSEPESYTKESSNDDIPSETTNLSLKSVKNKKTNDIKEVEEESKQFINTKSQNKKNRKKKKEVISESVTHEEPKLQKSKRKNIRIKNSELPSDLPADKQSIKKRRTKLTDSKNCDSEFDEDSYPSDSESDPGNEPQIALTGNINNRDESSDDSISSDEESRSSHVSEFDVDSYPSDTDEEVENNRGLPKNAIPSAELEEKEERTIFVGNLPYLVERSELKKWFSKFGKVECVRLRSAPISNPEIPRKVAVIKKTFHEERSNIHAYIRFHTLESAENAIQANGAVFNDHILRVDNSKHIGKYDPKKAIFIGNVPFSLEEDSLRQFFSECGDIESVRIVRDKNTGVGKGFAYINFKCSTSVPLALKLDGEVLEKRELRVKPVHYAKKNVKSFRQNFNSNFKFKGRHFPKQFRSSKIQNKSSKFQGEMSKRKIKNPPKKKSVLDRKHEKLAKIFTNKNKKDK